MMYSSSVVLLLAAATTSTTAGPASASIFKASPTSSTGRSGGLRAAKVGSASVSSSISMPKASNMVSSLTAGRKLAGACTADTNWNLANLDLSSFTVDGNLGDYTGFTVIPMFNGGKTITDGDKGFQIANGYLAYDCATKRLCAAAVLLPCYVEGSCLGPDSSILSVDEQDGNSWLEIEGVGPGGEPKFKGSNAGVDEFKYIADPGNTFKIGWEGCWSNIDMANGQLEVQLHFNREGQTTSTGKNVGQQGKLQTMCVNCPAPCDPADVIDPTTDPVTYPPLGPCQTYECNCETCTAVSANEGQLCDSSVECQNTYCNAGTCSDIQYDPNDTPCTIVSADDGYCCASTCQADSCSTGGNCPAATCGGGLNPPTLSAPLYDPANSFQCNPPTDFAGTRDVMFCTGDGATDIPGVVTSPSTGKVCGSYDVTWTSPPDCEGRVATETLSYTTADSPPTISVPADVNEECDYDLSLLAGPTVSDDCDATADISVSTPNDSESGDSCTTTIARTYTATDSCGNVATSNVQLITLVDTTAPDLTMPLDQTYECDGGLDSTDISTAGVATIDDNCQANPNLNGPTDSAEKDGECTKTISRVYTASDGCGNSISKTQTIVIEDTTPPTFDTAPEDTTFECSSGTGTATTPFPGTGPYYGSDTCTTGQLTASPSDTTPAGATCSSSLTRTWTVTDDCGRSTTTSQVVTVEDTTAPVFLTMPGEATVECGDDTSSASTGTPTADDACYPNTINIGESDATQDFTCGPNKEKEIITRTWTATDECNNPADADQVITVVDTTAPDLLNLPDLNKEYLCSDPCYTAPNAPPATAECAGTAPTGFDTCDSSVAVSTSEYGTDFGPGVEYTRTWTAADACGNEVSATQTITVNDACSFAVFDEFSGVSINVDITIINVEGGVQITATVNDPTYTGDLRGIFFEVTDATAVTDVTGAGVTSWLADAGGVDRLARDALMKGGGQNAKFYNVGVQVGTPGKKVDDIQSVTFVVEGISTDDIADGTYFGVRTTSVGPIGSNDRDESSKTTNPVICCRASV